MNKARCPRGFIRMSMFTQTGETVIPLDTALVGTHTHGFVPVVGSLFQRSWEELEHA